MARPSRRFGIIAAASMATSFPVAAHGGPASTASTGAVLPWESFIDEAASRFSVPASWIRAVIRIESSANPKALSSKGAVGLMQLMPDTYAELRIRYGLGDDPRDPHDNTVAGTAYLRDMHERFGTEGFIAAYNAGPQRYEEHLATGRPLPNETLAYVAKLAPLLVGTSSVGTSLSLSGPASWHQSPLFVAQIADRPSNTSSAFSPHAMFSYGERSTVDLSAVVPLSGGLFVGTGKTKAKP